MIKSVVSMQNGKLGKAEMLKMAAGILIGIGADMAASALLKHHVPLGRGWRKAMMSLGILAIGMKVGEDIENYFYKVWDETNDTLKEAKTEIENAEKEAEEETDGSGE